MRAISIKASLAALAALSICAVLAVAGVGGFAFWQSALRSAANANVAEALRLEMVVDMYHQRVKASLTEGLLTGQDSGAMAEATAGFRKSYKDLRKVDLPKSVSFQIASAKSITEKYLNTATEILELGVKDRQAALDRLPEFAEHFAKLQTELDRLAELLQRFSSEAQAASAATDRIYAAAIAAGTLVIAGLMALAAWGFGRAILRPILTLRQALTQVAEGDFALRLASLTKQGDVRAIARDIDRVSDRVLASMHDQAARQAEADQVIAELGSELQRLARGDLTAQIDQAFPALYDPLRRDFNAAVQQLSQSFRNVIEVSRMIHAQSTQLARASESLSARTETQAATLEETAATVEEVTGTMSSAADKAREVGSVVQRARGEVENSGKIVLGAVAAMNEIAASSGQISQIIGVIDDIAFQTNLLALNAGVEAARAGEAGRGFAVVASEVRALAQRSSTAAREIKELIGASTGQVDRGVAQVDQARQALASVVAEVGRIADLVGDIAHGSGEQARAMTEINLGVAQLDQVTQQNAAMAEETGAAFAQVADEVMALDRIVGQFTVEPAALAA